MNKKNLKKIFFPLRTGRNRFFYRNGTVSSPLKPMVEPLETGIREKDQVTGSRNREDLERDTLVRAIHLDTHRDTLKNKTPTLNKKTSKTAHHRVKR